MKSLEIQPLFVKKRFNSTPNFFFVKIPSFVALLKKSLFAFLVKELHLFLVLLYEIKFSLDGQFKYFFCFRLVHYCFAKVLSHERSMIPSYLFLFYWGVMIKYIVKNFSEFFVRLITIL